MRVVFNENALGSGVSIWKSGACVKKKDQERSFIAGWLAWN
jgi:hypothetical protein